MSIPPSNGSPALECLRALLAISREQALALEAEEIDRFDHLLEQREALLVQLGNAVRLPTPGTSYLDLAPGTAALALASTAREVIEQDRRNHAALGERLRQVRTELPILAAGSRAAGAYRTPAAGSAYVDRSS